MNRMLELFLITNAYGRMQEVTSQVASARKQLEAQRVLRESNINVTRPSKLT